MTPPPTNPGDGAGTASGSLVRTAIVDALAVLLPTECGGCGAPDRAVCGSCRASITPAPAPAPAPTPLPGASGGPPGPGIPVWAALEYDGVVPRLLSALKEQGRTDVSRELARPLGIALRAALAGVDRPPEDGASSGMALTPVPSSRRAMRARGYDPVRLLLRSAEPPVPILAGLRVVRRTRDQAGLAAAERERNLRGSMRGRRLLEGRPVLIVDDVLTTGATIREAVRAVTEAGGAAAGAVVLARVPRRR